MPRQLAKDRALEMSRDVPKKAARKEAVAASGKMFGTIDSSPSLSDRKASVITRKMTTAASSRL